MIPQTIQYEYAPGHFRASEPSVYRPDMLSEGEMILNMGPQHPSTHGVLRFEVVTDGEIVVDVVPHLGYLHRCFEKHAQSLPFNQTIPFVDRLDYLAAMNSEHAFVMGVERMLGIQNDIPKRTEYIRVLVAELNRIAGPMRWTLALTHLFCGSCATASTFSGCWSGLAGLVCYTIISGLVACSMIYQLVSRNGAANLYSILNQSSSSYSSWL